MELPRGIPPPCYHSSAHVSGSIQALCSDDNMYSQSQSMQNLFDLQGGASRSHVLYLSASKFFGSQKSKVVSDRGKIFFPGNHTPLPPRGKPRFLPSLSFFSTPPPRRGRRAKGSKSCITLANTTNKNNGKTTGLRGSLALYVVVVGLPPASWFKRIVSMETLFANIDRPLGCVVLVDV